MAALRENADGEMARLQEDLGAAQQRLGQLEPQLQAALAQAAQAESEAKQREAELRAQVAELQSSVSQLCALSFHCCLDLCTECYCVGSSEATMAKQVAEKDAEIAEAVRVQQERSQELIARTSSGEWRYIASSLCPFVAVPAD